MMIKGTRFIRLDKLNIAAESPRKDYHKGPYKKLYDSIKTHGILVPILVREIGKGEYAIIDGVTRVRILREQGAKPSTLVPCAILDADDADAIQNSLISNQIRQRLSSLSEAEALRALVKDYGRTASDVAKALGKTRGWASQILASFELPNEIWDDVRGGKISVKHATTIARFRDKPGVVKLLHRLAKEGTSSSRLAIIGKEAVRLGTREAEKLKPKITPLGKKSFVRFEPVKNGIRLEIHINKLDNLDKILSEVRRLV